MHAEITSFPTCALHHNIQKLWVDLTPIVFYARLSQRTNSNLVLKELPLAKKKLLNISTVKILHILYKLLDFTVSIPQKMELEKCNVFNRLFCSTFETYFNFNLFWLLTGPPNVFQGNSLRAVSVTITSGLTSFWKTDKLNTLSI